MSNKTTIIIGDDGLLKRCQIASLKDACHKVIALGNTATEAEIFALKPEIVGELRVVFTPYEHDEFALLDQGEDTLVATTGALVKSFLTQSQAALQLLMGAGGGQLWVADFDDSFAYHLQTPCAPIASQARAGAVRSMAKEYSRMRIYVNSLLVQPVSDEHSAPMFRQAAAGLKSYAMRYKPNDAVDVANLLTGFVQAERLQFSGNIIGTGTGIVQSHLTA